MNNTAITYALYLAISIALTAWVARTLHRNGRVFLVKTFQGNDELADSVNHLLVVGFYLLNIGFVVLALKTGMRPEGAAAVFELLSQKVGIVLLVLGGMHFGNLALFHRLYRRARVHQTPPPVEPNVRLAPPEEPQPETA